MPVPTDVKTCVVDLSLYFFWFRIRNPELRIRIQEANQLWIYPNPTWTFLWPMKKNVVK